MLQQESFGPEKLRWVSWVAKLLLCNAFPVKHEDFTDFCLAMHTICDAFDAGCPLHAPAIFFRWAVRASIHVGFVWSFLKSSSYEWCAWMRLARSRSLMGPCIVLRLTPSALAVRMLHFPAIKTSTRRVGGWAQAILFELQWCFSTQQRKLVVMQMCGLSTFCARSDY